MIRIGDFARLARVSVETLRHYDELGLLKPERVDEFTGYRYYAPAQFAQLNRILALKDLGLSLSQVLESLNGITLEEMTGMLKLRQAEAERALAEEQARLSRIASLLKQIELEENMPEYDVVLKDLPPVLVVSRRVTVPTNDQVPAYLGPAFDAAYGALRAAGARDTGPCISVWHQPAAVLANEIVEAVVPVDRRFEPNGEVVVYDLTGGPVASVVHEGPFEGMKAAHVALLSWIEANGYESDGTYREVNHQVQPGNAVVEIQYPVRKARA